EMDIADVKGECDTVVQNPPFGVQRDKADRIFLEKALEVGEVIYSMHKMETQEFIKGYVQKLNGKIAEIMTIDFILPYSYGFHRKRAVKTKVDIYRILSAS
ncbi:MAG: METTL5 family protein, partial [Candidatus Hydrothermarchaeales archaeon]